MRRELTADVGSVWDVIDDFDLLARGLPGAELVETLDRSRYRGRATIALGPVKLRFEGLAQVVEREPSEHRLNVLAHGADAGGSATCAVIGLRVEPGEGGGSVLAADADLHLSGRIAQFGRALAGDVSRRLFEQFGRAVDEAARTGRAPDVSSTGPSPLRMAAGAAGDVDYVFTFVMRPTAVRLRLMKSAGKPRQYLAVRNRSDPDRRP